MKWGLDAAYAPTADAAFRERSDGWDFYCGYIGGKALNVWRAQDWHTLDALGFALLPIWVAPLVEDAGHQVGVEDGNAALMKLQELGLSGTVALDVENGLAPRAYASGFVDACTAGSCGVVLYGSETTIKKIGDLPFAAWWLCGWILEGQPYHPAPPDWGMWQYAEGPGADYNAAVDDFPFALLQSPERPLGSPSAEA